jgi:hypothetical protein
MTCQIINKTTSAERKGDTMQAEELVISFFERVYNQKDFAYVFEMYADN